MTLLDDAIDAHGGLAAWQRADPLSLRVRATGPAFTAKGHPRSADGFSAVVAAAERQVVLTFPTCPGERFELGPNGTSMIRSAEVITSIGGVHPSMRPWQLIELAHFCAAALWTYVAVPFVLHDRSVAVTRELPGRRLEVTFAPTVRTHSRSQTIHLDADGRIVRHDYTAEAISPWARAAQQVSDHRCFDGVVIGTRRVVRPRRRDGRPHRRPVLLAIEIAHAPATDRASPPAGSPYDDE